MAGCPNITGTITAKGNSSNEVFASATGAMSVGGTTANWGIGQNDGVSGKAYGKVSFDASRSSSIYGSSETITPLSESVIMCISY